MTTKELQKIEIYLNVAQDFQSKSLLHHFHAYVELYNGSFKYVCSIKELREFLKDYKHIRVISTLYFESNVLKSDRFYYCGRRYIDSYQNIFKHAVRNKAGL